MNDKIRLKLFIVIAVISSFILGWIVGSGKIN